MRCEERTESQPAIYSSSSAKQLIGEKHKRFEEGAPSEPRLVERVVEMPGTDESPWPEPLSVPARFQMESAQSPMSFAKQSVPPCSKAAATRAQIGDIDRRWD